MPTLIAAKREAKRAGVSAKALRGADTVKEVRALMAEASNGTGTKARGKRVVKKAVSTTKKATARKGKAKSASSKPAPAKGRKNSGAAKRRATATVEDSGRNLLGDIDWTDTEGWNPREDSVPDIVVKALRKAKGNRERAYSALVKMLGDLVPVKTRQGNKRTKGEREQYLRYLIARNAWAFAMATGQHEKAENRVEYGTGGTGGSTVRRKSATKTKAKAQTVKKATKAQKGTRKAARGTTRGKAAARKAGKAAARKRTTARKR